MPIPPTVQARLTANGVNMGMPGWTIVDNAGMLPPLPTAAPNVVIGDAPAAGLQKLMNAFYNFGRTRWRWSTSSSAAAGMGGLVKGVANNCACATFNDNLKFLAEACCGIQGIQRQALNDQFLTIPGGTCIDGTWLGNVRTERDGYDQFKCFKFATHYWLSLAGQNYDACYNNIFASQEQVIFSRLVPDHGACTKYNFPVDKLRKLTKPLPNATHLLEIQAAGTTANGWPLFQLVNEGQLKKLK